MNIFATQAPTHTPRGQLQPPPTLSKEVDSFTTIAQSTLSSLSNFMGEAVSSLSQKVRQNIWPTSVLRTLAKTAKAAAMTWSLLEVPYARATSNDTCIAITPPTKHIVTPGMQFEIPIDPELFQNPLQDPEAFLTLEGQNSEGLSVHRDYKEVGSYPLTDGKRSFPVGNDTLLVLENGSLETVHYSSSYTYTPHQRVPVETPQDVIVFNGRVVVAAAENGLLVFDSPKNLELITTIPTTNALALAIDEEEEMLLLADGDGGALAFDKDLNLIASDTSIKNVRDVDVKKGNAFFVTAWFLGQGHNVHVRSTNSSDPLTPKGRLVYNQSTQKIHTGDDGQAFVIGYYGTSLYLMLAVNITDPNNPTLIPSNLIPTNPVEITGNEKFIFVSNNEGGLLAYRKEDGYPLSGQKNWGSVTRHTEIHDGKAYVTTKSGVHVLDLNQPLYLLKGSFPLPGIYPIPLQLSAGSGVTENATMKVMADHDPVPVMVSDNKEVKPHQLFTMNIPANAMFFSNSPMVHTFVGAPKSFTWRANFPRLHSIGNFILPTGVATEKENIFVGDMIGRTLNIFGANNDGQLTNITTIETFFRDLAITDHYIIVVARSQGTKLYDRNSFELLDTLPLPDGMSGETYKMQLWKEKEMIFVGTRVADILQAMSYSGGVLTELSRVPLSGISFHLQLDEKRGLLFLLEGDKMKIYNVQNPREMVMERELTKENSGLPLVERSSSFALKDHLLFVSDGYTLHIYDTSDVSNFTLIKKLDFPYISRLKIIDQFLIVVKGTLGVDLYFLPYPTPDVCGPAFIGNIDAGGRAEDVDIDTDRSLLYVTLDNQSLNSYSIKDLTYTLEGIPTEEEIGNYQMNTVGLTPYGKSANTIPFTLGVLGKPQPNQKQTDLFFRTGSPINQATQPNLFTHPNGQQLSLSAQGLPGGIHFNLVSHEISGQTLNAGTSHVTLIARDQKNEIAQQEFSMIFKHPLLPTGETPNTVCKQGQPCVVERLYELIHNPNGEPVSLQISVDGGSLPFSETNGTLNINSTHTGNWNLKTIYSDQQPDGATVTRELPLTIEAPIPPKVKPQSTISASPGDRVVIDTRNLYTFEEGVPIDCSVTYRGQSQRELPPDTTFDEQAGLLTMNVGKQHLAHFGSKEYRLVFSCNGVQTEVSVSIDGTSTAETAVRVLTAIFSSYFLYFLFERRWYLVNPILEPHSRHRDFTAKVGNTITYNCNRPGENLANKIRSVKVLKVYEGENWFSRFLGLNIRPILEGVDIPYWLRFDTNTVTLSSDRLERKHIGNYKFYVYGPGGRSLVRCKMRIIENPGLTSNGARTKAHQNDHSTLEMGTPSPSVSPPPPPSEDPN